MTTNINAIELADSLAEGGFSAAQAKTLATTIWWLIDTYLVTKDDLAAFEQRILHRFEMQDERFNVQEERFNTKLAQLKVELVMWIISLMVVQSGVTAVLFKLLH
jgi:hypothetical protein